MSPSRLIILTAFCFVCLLGQTNGVVLVMAVVNVLKSAKDVSLMLIDAWELVDKVGDLPRIFNTKHKELMKKIQGIDSKLEDTAAKIDDIDVLTTHLTKVLRGLPNKIRLELRLNDLLDYMTQINSNYERMQEYSRKPEDFERLTLEDFAESVTSHGSDSVINLLQRIHAFVVSQGAGITDTGLFKSLAAAVQDVENDMMCSTHQSPQQILYSLFEVIAFTELKGYTMVQFSYMILRLYGKGNFAKEVLNTRKAYEERTNAAVTTVSNLLQKLSREVWRCDPENYEEGETYEQITNLLQGYIQNVKGLNKDGSCIDKCDAYNYNTESKCEQNYCGHQRKCLGNLIKCELLDSDATICMAQRDSHRRYEYVEFDDNKVWGRKKGQCRNTARIFSWRDWLVLRCSYCLCLCDEQGALSDRYFNMKSALSDISHNKIVTGLRFVKNNRIIHLQIQEGEILPRLKVNASTVSWKPVDDYTILDRKVYNGQEFHTLTWGRRQIDFDDLEAEDGYVLTGVRFREIGSHLNLQIYTTKFDFETGQIYPQDSKWVDNPNIYDSKIPRRQVRLSQPDIPTRTKAPSIPTSHSNEYIEFTHSDVNKDVAQTTVPFLDIQKVESLEPVPLAGAGLFHKGRPQYGGFIAPKIITYDVTKYLKAVFPSDEKN